MIEDGHDTKVKDNPLNENWSKQEFQELWKRINQRYACTVEFDSPELIDQSVAALNANLRVTELQYTLTAGVQTGADFGIECTQTRELKHAAGSSVRYDLIGKIAEQATLTRRSAAEILKGLTLEKRGSVKHIFFIAETKGTMNSLHLRPIEQAKISCTRKLFNEISKTDVKYHDADSYQSLLDVMRAL